MPTFAATNTTAQTSATEQRYACDIIIDGTVVRPYQSYTFDEFTSDILTAMDEDTVCVVHQNGPFSLADLPSIGFELVRSVGLVRVYGIQGQTHIEQTVLSLVAIDAPKGKAASVKEVAEEARAPAAAPVEDTPAKDEEPANDTAHAQPADMIADEVEDEPAPTPDAPEEPAADEPAEPEQTEDVPSDAPADEPATPVLAYDVPAADLHWRTVVGIIEKADSKESLAGFLAEDEARVAVLKAYAARFPA